MLNYTLHSNPSVAYLMAAIHMNHAIYWNRTAHDTSDDLLSTKLLEGVLAVSNYQEKSLEFIQLVKQLTDEMAYFSQLSLKVTSPDGKRLIDTFTNAEEERPNYYAEFWYLSEHAGQIASHLVNGVVEISPLQHYDPFPTIRGGYGKQDLEAQINSLWRRICPTYSTLRYPGTSLQTIRIKRDQLREIVNTRYSAVTTIMKYTAEDRRNSIATNSIPLDLAKAYRLYTETQAKLYNFNK